MPKSPTDAIDIVLLRSDGKLIRLFSFPIPSLCRELHRDRRRRVTRRSGLRLAEAHLPQDGLRLRPQGSPAAQVSGVGLAALVGAGLADLVLRRAALLHVHDPAPDVDGADGLSQAGHHHARRSLGRLSARPGGESHNMG